MKKSHLILFIAGGLVAIGMSMLYIGSTFIAQQTTNTEGTASIGSPVELTREMDPQVAKVGAFVIISEEFENGELKATVFDPAGNQIAASEIKQKSVQREFDINIKGNYKLVLENSKESDVQVVLAIAYTPDAALVALSYVGFYMIVAGFLGVVVALAVHLMSKPVSIAGQVMLCLILPILAFWKIKKATKFLKYWLIIIAVTLSIIFVPSFLNSNTMLSILSISGILFLYFGSFVIPIHWVIKWSKEYKKNSNL